MPTAAGFDYANACDSNPASVLKWSESGSVAIAAKVTMKNEAIPLQHQGLLSSSLRSFEQFGLYLDQAAIMCPTEGLVKVHFVRFRRHSRARVAKNGILQYWRVFALCQKAKHFGPVTWFHEEPLPGLAV